MTDLQLSEEDIDAYLGVLESGWLTMGPRTRAFEETFAERFGVFASKAQRKLVKDTFA